MATISQFEGIEAWKAARVLTNQIYDISERGAFSRDFGLRDQMRRAAVSIMSNIAEGFERDGNKEFLQFLSFAKGSVGELRSQLYVALDRRYVDQSAFDEIQRRSLKISRMLSGLMSYLRSCKLRGRKYENNSGPTAGPAMEIE